MSEKTSLILHLDPDDTKAYGSNQGSHQTNDDSKLKDVRKQVETVVEIMRDNVEKAIVRDQKVNDLEDKSDALREGALRFESRSKKLKRQMCRKNAKFWGILLLVIAVFLIIIIIIATQHAKNNT